ncbi:DNA polymerase III subunit delta [Lactobacillaceae bacterium L1_55_11]|nr:DNA polymerase III subunit delta [Lactobacillaceae bacterium L1_55_11]
MNLKQLKEQISHQALANFYLLSGEEPVLLNRARSLFQDSVPEDEQALNFAFLDGQDLDWGAMLNELSTPSFLGDRRVIFIQRPLFLTAAQKPSRQEEDQLLSILEQPVMDNVVVWAIGDLKLDKRKKITKAILKSAEKIDLPKLDTAQGQRYIKAQLEQAGFSIDPAALNELTNRTNADYSQMVAQLSKLRAYAQDAHHIDQAAVAGLVPQVLNASAFDLVDAVMAGQIHQALTQYQDLLGQGEAPLRINAVLTGQFRLLLQVAALRGNANIAQTLGVHPYRVKLAERVLGRYALDRLKAGYLGMLDIEIALKSRTSDPSLLFERFLIKLSNQKARV